MKNNDPFMQGARRVKDIDNSFSQRLQAGKEEDPFMKGAIPVQQAKTREALVKQEENPFMSVLTGFRTPFDKLGHGILQPVLESGYLGENVKRHSKDLAHQREQDYAQSLEANPISTMGGNIAGEAAISAPAILASGGGAAPGIFRGMLGGAVGGAARGIGEYSGERDSRLVNALWNSILGAAGGSIPGLVKQAAKVPGVIRNIKQGTPKKFAKTIEADRNRVISEANKVYSSLDKRATEAGVTNIFKQKPTSELIEHAGKPKVNADIGKKLNYDYLKDNISGDALESFKKFLHDDSFKNARELSTALRLESQKLSKSAVRLPASNKVINHIDKAKNKLDKNITKSLRNSDKPELAAEYPSIQKWYADEVAPLRHNQKIKKYLSGKKSEAAQDKLFQRMKIDEDFQDALGKKYPQLHSRDSLKKIGKGLGYGGAAIGGPFGTYFGLKSLFGGSSE